MRHLLSTTLLLCCSGCSFFGTSRYEPLDVVPSVDIQRYCGKWYEIASRPVSQQEGCYCTTAEYSILEDGVLKVVNTCRKGGTNGSIDQAEGKAFVVENSNNAKLRVQFFWPFRGDYWIIDLADDYSYAVVGVPNRKYFWILSRTAQMDPALLDRLVHRVKEKGFDISTIQRTVHGCP